MKEAMKLALDALIRSKRAVSEDLDLAGCAYGSVDSDGHRYADAKKALSTLKQAIKALEEALAQDMPKIGCVNHDCEKCKEQGEPVAWQYRDANADGTWSAWLGCDKQLTESTWREVRPLYTAPPAAKRPWVGLSEEEIDKLKHLIDWTATWSYGRFAYEIEQLLKEKNA